MISRSRPPINGNRMALSDVATTAMPSVIIATMKSRASGPRATISPKPTEETVTTAR